MTDASWPMQIVTEDFDILSAFISVMRVHTPSWPRRGHKGAPVFGQGAGSALQAFKLIDSVWKTSGLTVLGIIVDAEDQFDSRWQSVKRFSEKNFPSVPSSMPTTGLILANEQGKKFGAWIMPNNQAAGMLESFCADLIQKQYNAIWQHSKNQANSALGHGATYKSSHTEKANLHTFLAWLDPPGQRIGESISSNDLDCRGPAASNFVNWCKNLYGI
jgi:hypothetical protein